MKKRGVGIGCMWYGIGNTGLPNPAGAFIDWLDDGTVNLFVGAADIGQGSDTVLAQIVAEELGVNYEDIKVTSADTGTTPDGGATSASRQTFISGNAVLQAAQAVKDVVVQEAAELLGVGKEQLVFRNRRIYLQGQEQHLLRIEEVLGSCRRKGIQTIAHGYYNPDTTKLDPETGQGNPYGAYAFATQVVQIEIDTATGQIEVINIFAAHDVGCAINPGLVETQIEGGSVMGLGYGLFEEIITDQGRIKTPSLSTYLIPTMKDIPNIYPLIVEEPVESGPYGAKGVGEPALIPTAAAIANAVYDATGIRFTELPLTPEKVLRKLKEKENMIGGDAAGL